MFPVSYRFIHITDPFGCQVATTKDAIRVHIKHKAAVSCWAVVKWPMTVEYRTTNAHLKIARISTSSPYLENIFKISKKRKVLLPNKHVWCVVMSTCVELLVWACCDIPPPYIKDGWSYRNLKRIPLLPPPEILAMSGRCHHSSRVSTHMFHKAICQPVNNLEAQTPDPAISAQHNKITCKYCTIVA